MTAIETQSRSLRSVLRAWGFTQVETTLLAAIVMRGAVSFKDALEELYGDSRHKSHLNIKHIISSIRKKLTPRKVAISTIKNFGWQIDDENRNRVLQACDSK